VTSETDLTTAFECVELETAEPFGIARGTTTGTENVVVRIGDGEHTGLGAAAPSAHYGETAATVAAVLPDLLAVVEDVGDPQAIGAVHDGMARVVRQNPAAKAAVDIALHDLCAKRADLPLSRYLGLGTSGVTSSYTVGLADPERMAETANAAFEAGYEALKVKLGAPDGADRQRFDAVRSAVPAATIRVDANEAWAPKQARRNAQWLADGDVEFLEQPVPAADPEGLRQVYEHAPLPIAVDESCEVASDVPRVADRADVVVVKLMKCGGVRPAIETIHAARAHGLAVMLGCMLETNAAIAAGVQFAPLLDYADLDGSLLLASDPYDGVPMPGGHIDPAAFDRPGTGARPTDE
jgi:L-alanine-DL-glutamate epimerase-like enolase superfamily enzyme